MHSDSIQEMRNFNMSKEEISWAKCWIDTNITWKLHSIKNLEGEKT